ncbi:MAG: substrate-binding domain-containing protein [Desulfobacteraceae bacterium]|nr:substrate-binding domain-containing protein [Desulfobacteraceae bacterium]
MLRLVDAIVFGFAFISIIRMVLPAAAAEKIDPPWNKPPDGLSFTVPGIENVSDLHGDIVDPDLVVFFGGNEFMVMPSLMEAFQKKYPRYRKIFYETLPPGIIQQQVNEKALVVGNLRIALQPDVFTGGKEKMNQLQDEGWFEETVPYARNTLAIMVKKGNPKRVLGIKDLGRDDVRVSMPNPELEDIGKKIIATYTREGGAELKRKIMDAKVKDKTTFVTRIHHRQTPIRIMQETSDAGPVWYTEAFFQQMIGNPVEMVEVPSNEDTRSTSVAGRMKNAPHPRAGSDFLQFLQSSEAQAIFKQYGFSSAQ